MVRIIATKKIDIHCISALATIRVKEKRPNIVWLLNNIGHWDFSEGEISHLEQFLEKNLGLLKDGQLTPVGQKAIESGEILYPESGLYEIFYVNDPLIGEKIIDFKRLKPFQENIEGNTEEFRYYTEYDDSYSESWRKESTEFHLKFEHAQNENPRVLRRTALNATLTVTYDSKNGCTLRIESDNGVYSYQDTNYTDFSFTLNMERLVDNWDQELIARLVSYDNIEETTAFHSFESSVTLEGQNLFFSWGEDTGNYRIDITKIQVLPRSKNDAEKWLYCLVVNEIEREEAYQTLKYVEEVEEKILGRTPLRRRFPELQIGGKGYLNLISQDENLEVLASKIWVAEDLWPEI